MGALRFSVLVLTEDPVFRTFAEDVIIGRGAAVHSCGTLEEGLRRIRQGPPHVVVLDAAALGVQGSQALQALTVAAPGTSIVVIASEDSSEAILKALRTGAADYLVKPVSAEGLWESVAWGAERERAAEEASLEREVLSSLQRFSAGLSHAINNPAAYVLSNLMVLDGYVRDLRELVRSGSRLAESVQAGNKGVSDLADRFLKLSQELNAGVLLDDLGRIVEESHHGVRRIARIVRDLRALSGEEGGGALLKDLNQLVEAALMLTETELERVGRVVRELGPVPPIDCQPMRLGQVIAGILLNAAEALDERKRSGGEVRVRTFVATDGQRVCLEIKDNGPGMAPEVLRNAFLPFYSTRNPGGREGLGLSVAYGVVQRHGGDIEIESIPGRGTRVRMWLPVAGTDRASGSAPLKTA